MASEKNFNLPNITDTPSTQKELAEKYGITQQTMNNYMRLAKAIPELEELVDTGKSECHNGTLKKLTLAEKKSHNGISNNKLFLSEIGGKHQRVHNGLSAQYYF